MLSVDKEGSTYLVEVRQKLVMVLPLQIHQMLELCTRNVIKIK